MNIKGIKIKNQFCFIRVSIIEKLNYSSEQFRKQREKMYIQKFNTKYKGLNQKTQLIAYEKNFKKHFSYWFRRSEYFTNVLTFKSQSDVDIVKISKYITGEFIFWLTLQLESFSSHLQIKIKIELISIFFSFFIS